MTYPTARLRVNGTLFWQQMFCGKSMFDIRSESGTIHPTQQPDALFEYLIRTYINPGELVLDNCMGSGTTAIACLNGRGKYVGFELDLDYPPGRDRAY